MAYEIDMKLFSMGDHKEFGRIYHMHNRGLFYYVKKLTGNEQEAEDIVQSTFIVLYKKHKDFEAAPAIKVFLYTTARNKGLNYLKSENCHSGHKDKIRHQSNDYQEAEALRALISTDLSKDLRNAIEKLPPTCRKVFALYQEKKSNAEIADILSISIQNVRTQLYYARKTLRKLI